MTTYMIRRENAERDWDALQAILDNDGIVGGDVVVLEQIAKSIRAQIPKPAVADPEWGSVVRGRTSEYEERVRWVRPSPGPGWYSEHGAFVGGFQMLQDVEVLRVGIGPKLDPHVATMLDAFQKPVPTDADEFMVSAGFDPTPAQEASYLKGVEDFAAKVRRELAALRSTVVTAPEKRTCDHALALVAALLGES